MNSAEKARERRVTRRLETRGLRGLGQALCKLRGTQIAGRWELGSLFAVGAEGAVFLCHDVWDATQPTHVAKIALLPYHKPFQLSFDEVRRRRELLREESRHLETSASKYMPEFLGLFEFDNPLLDSARGGEFAKGEPVFVMERLPGADLDYWLARVHSSRVPKPILRRNVDHVTIVVLRGLWDLHERGYFYCDLRPGNVRIRGRSEHRVRLMDAGSLVPRADTSGGFPHVPAYLPPALFWRSQDEGLEVLVPSLEIQAVMAGRTLFEVATGRVPVPGEQVDVALLRGDTVSPEVADTIEGLCDGTFKDVFQALTFLAKRTNRGRTAGRPEPEEVAAPAPPSEPEQPEPESAETEPSEMAEEPAPVEEAVEEHVAAEPVAPAAPVTRTRDLASLLAEARATSRPAAHPRPAIAAASAAPAIAASVATAELPEFLSEEPAAAARPSPAPAAKQAPRRRAPAPAAIEPDTVGYDDGAVLPPPRRGLAAWWARVVAPFKRRRRR